MRPLRTKSARVMLLRCCSRHSLLGPVQEWSQKQAQRAALRARTKAGGRGAGDRRLLEPEVRCLFALC